MPTIAVEVNSKLKQFGVIVAQENGKNFVLTLPIKAAIKHGHTTIGDGSGSYEELIYCGDKEGHPIFTVTSTTPRQVNASPSPEYMRMLCIGLSQDQELKARQVADYLFRAPGIGLAYKRQDLSGLFYQINATSDIDKPVPPV